MEHINEKILKILLSKEQITTEDLYQIGLTDDNINDLRSNNILAKCGNYFDYIKYEDYCEFGDKLVKKQRLEDATKIYLACFKVNPYFGRVTFILFAKAIYDKDYRNVFYYLDFLINSKSVAYQREINAYLYLLNYITQIPLRFKKRLNEINDFYVKESDSSYYTDVNLENLLRNAIINKDFGSAIEYAKTIKSFPTIKPHERLLLHLTFDVTHKYEMDKRDLIINMSNGQLDLVKPILFKYRNRNIPFPNQENYEELVDALGKIKNKYLVFNDYKKLINKYHNSKDDITNCMIDIIMQEYEHKNNNVVKVDYEVKISDAMKQMNNFSTDPNIDLINSSEVVVIEGLTEKQVNNTIEQMRNLPNIVLIPIEKPEEYKLLIKIKDDHDQNIFYTSLMAEGMEAYESREYNKCIINFKTLLRVVDNPDIYIYVKIGLAYMKKSNYAKDTALSLKYLKEAIKYLNIVNDLNDKNTNIYDFSNLVNRLDFSKREDIIKLKEREEMTVDNEKMKEIEEYYRLAQFNNGDILWKKTFKTANKEERKVLEKIRCRRNFYQHDDSVL